MFSILKELIAREQFNPKILGLFINPFYFARKGLYQSVSLLIVRLKGNLLDIGCVTKPYERMCNVDKYTGLEIDDEGNRNHSFADIFYDGNLIPFQDKKFDSILVSQVIEHRKSKNGVEVIFQLINAYLYKITVSKSAYANLLLSIVLMAPVNIMGLILSKILPKNDDLYLDNIVLAKKARDV